MWIPDQEDFEVCIPYLPERQSKWLGHRCRCCDAGWVLEQKPRGFNELRVIGILPLNLIGAEA